MLLKKNLINKNKFLLFLFYNALITIVLLYASNINRPDAGLYHLPYTSLINENKIIIGSANIHFRFGHISIIQYLSAIYNNYLFNTSNITLPLASVFSIFLIFSIKKMSEHLKSGTNGTPLILERKWFVFRLFHIKENQVYHPF